MATPAFTAPLLVTLPLSAIFIVTGLPESRLAPLSTLRLDRPLLLPVPPKVTEDPLSITVPVLTSNVVGLPPLVFTLKEPADVARLPDVVALINGVLTEKLPDVTSQFVPLSVRPVASLTDSGVPNPPLADVPAPPARVMPAAAPDVG